MRRAAVSLCVALLGSCALAAAGPKPRCTYVISPTSASVAAGSASGSVSVTAPAGCTWTARSNDPFVTITAGSKGLGSGSVSYRVAENAGASPRTGTLTVARQTFTVTQDAAPLPPPPSYNLDLPPRPAGGNLIVVPAGGDLQAAIAAAQPNDVIQLTAGATYSGNFVLPAKGGSGYIMIRSAAPDALLPPEGQRIAPSDAALLPKIKSPNSGPAIATAPGASHYRLQYLEFLPNAVGSGDIIRLGDGSAAQDRLDEVPHDLVVDQCYIHGAPGAEQRRGIALNSGLTWIASSHIDEIKSVGSDSQAIGGWNGPGPYRIYNNHLSAAGENFMLGGADPAILDLVPSDIVFRYNYLTKPTSWRGSSWQVKNIFELKNAQQVVIDSNVFEYNWLAAQPGYAILFTPRNQGGTAPWVVVQHVQFTNNLVRHVSSVFNILGVDDVYPSRQTNDISIVNNVFEDVSGQNWGGVGRLMIVTGAVNVTVDHNTVFQDGGSFVYAYGEPTVGFVMKNTIVPDNAYGIMGQDASPGNGTIARYFPGGLFARNVIVHCQSPWSYPADNYYPAAWEDVGFVDMTGGDYRLTATSPYLGTATDGRSPGADQSLIPR